MPTRRELILSTTVTVLGASALAASATKILTNKNTASRGCLSCGPVQGSSVDGDPDQEFCESLIVDAGEDIELIPSGGEKTETNEWDALYGTINVDTNGVIHYTAPSYRPPYGMDYFSRVDDLGQATYLKLKVINGVAPVDIIVNIDENGQEVPIDLSDPEWTEEPCPEVSLLPSIAVSDIPFINSVSTVGEGNDISETVELFQLPDTGAITLFLQQKQKPGQLPKPKPKKCHQNCQTNPIPTNCNGKTEWDVPGKIDDSDGGGYDWVTEPYKLVVTGDNKLIVRKYFGGNFEIGMTIETTYKWRTVRKKRVQFTDHYECIDGKPKFVSTRVCVRKGEMMKFLPAWWAEIFAVQNGETTWDPPLTQPPSCYTIRH